MTEIETTKIKHHYLTALAVLVALALAVSALAGEAGPAKAAFPGANGKIAFMSMRDGNPEIYAMNPDGSNQTNLTTNNAFDYDPSFSPDGNRIAFSSSRSGNYEIFTMNALDGSTQKNRSNHGAVDVEPDWGVATP